MIRVTVEIVPGGQEDRKEVLGVIEIANVTKLAPISNYSYVAWSTSSALQGEDPVRGEVHDHPRDDGWAVLLRRTLQDLFARSGGFGRFSA